MKNQSETFYIGLAICKSATLNNGTELDLVWAEGQVGAIPVFSSYDAAKEYYGDREDVQILHLQANENI